MKWIETVNDDGFKGRVQVDFSCSEWKEPTFVVKIINADQEELFNEHYHIDNPALAASEAIKSVIENILWEIKDEQK